jgi:hypothetical protein
VLLAAAATQALATAAASATNNSSSSSKHVQDADDTASPQAAAAAESAREWYDFGRALQHVRPRVPAWGFASMPTVVAGFRQRGACGLGEGFGIGGLSAVGLKLMYDVQFTLVKRRTPGVWA